MKAYKTILAGICLIIWSYAAAARGNAPATYYVSPSGSDHNPGTLALPFASLQKARDVVKTVSGSMTGDIIVYLRGGTYTLSGTVVFNQTHSGTNGYNIKYMNYPGETPVISGGQAITGWTLYDAAKNIYKATGVNFEFRQLYVNGTKAIRARTPNKGSWNTAINFSRANQWVAIHKSEIAAWNNFTKVEMAVQNWWTESYLRLSSYTTDTSNAYVKLHTEEDTVIFKRPYPGGLGDPIFGGAAYYFENAYEFIDAEGEWYRDADAHALYYKPRAGETMASVTVIAPRLDTLVSLRGTLDNPVHHIWFYGISFMFSNWTRPSNYGQIDAQAFQYNVYAGMNNVQKVGHPPAAVTVVAAHDIRIERNIFRFLGATGLDFFYGTHDDIAIGNVFQHISGGGISAGKFVQDSTVDDHVPYNPADQREIVTNETISDNYITSVAEDYWGAVPIVAGYPRGLRIEHNEVDGSLYTGISVGYGWSPANNAMSGNLIRYNYVHDYMQLLGDGGGIYTLSKQPGTTIDENYIAKGSPPLEQGALYFDNGSSNMFARANVIQNVNRYVYLDGTDKYNIVMDNNYSDVTNHIFAGTGCSLTNMHIRKDNKWVSKAQNVINNAGLQPAYRNIRGLIGKPDGSPQGFVREVSGIRVPVSNGTLRLQVFSDRIVRVSFAPGDSIPSKEEFSVVKSPQTAGWKAYQDKDNIVLSTRLVTARVDKGGTVRFYDRNGKLLLAELPGGRKMRRATSNYAPEQGFAVGDEALYGLGQFQNGLVNWKNVPLRLQQFNQEDAVPFLVSTKGYGVFWDNYSVTDFNPPSKELSFRETIDSSANIRRTKFIPTLSGDYSFAVESRNPGNRFQGPVLLTLNGDTVIHYSTVWVPEWHTGRIKLQAGKAYTIVLQNSNSQAPGNLYYNAPDYNKTVFRSTIGDMIDYYFVYGQTAADIISGYRELTGAAPMPGKWVLGFWQCRERYHSQGELLENAREYRKRKIPVDMIVQDWNYWPAGTWGPEWNRQLYPDPAKMIRELREDHFHLMVSVWPRVANPKLESRYHFTGHTIDDSSGNLDLYSAGVRKEYYRMIKDSMFDLGVSSIWLDGSEPESCKKNATTVAGPFDKVALTYPLKVTQSLYEGQRMDYPGQRVFNFTRSAFPGMQRYGAGYWTGDVMASWEQFRQQIAGGLNFAMTGLPYWTTDAGGFFRDQQSLNPAYDNQYTNPGYKELLTRWFQFAAFCPILRIHGYVSNTEIWRYGADFERTARAFIDLRYQLMPYLYSLAGAVTQKGSLIMAPLVHDYPEDKNTWKISDQFLLGASILVNPVVEQGAHSRNIYLPKGDWYDFWTGSKLAGGRNVTVGTSMEKIPLMVKAGTILPVGPALQYVLQPDSTPLKIFIYPGSNGSFALYEDEGENYNYEKGHYSIIPLQWNDKERTLTVGERKGSFSGMLRKRKIGIVLAGRAGVKGLDNKLTDVSVVYDGKRQVVRL